jgi:Mg-chelatase subunit ChlD
VYKRLRVLYSFSACIKKVADIVFVVDSSGSIGADNFQKVRQFIRDVVMTFDVGPNSTRVGLVEYSTSAHIEFKLNEKTNRTDLLSAVDAIAYSGGGTSTSDALELMRLQGFDGYVALCGPPSPSQPWDRLVWLSN